jgi:hypothetical protein
MAKKRSRKAGLRRKNRAGFTKVWFANGSEKTAGLILPTAKVHAMSVNEISRLFPTSEARKMKRVHISPEFETWDEAFDFKT